MIVTRFNTINAACFYISSTLRNSTERYFMPFLWNLLLSTQEWFGFGMVLTCDLDKHKELFQASDVWGQSILFFLHLPKKRKRPYKWQNGHDGKSQSSLKWFWVCNNRIKQCDNLLSMSTFGLNSASSLIPIYMYVYIQEFILGTACVHVCIRILLFICIVL